MNIDLATLTKAQGFKVKSSNSNLQAGYSISSSGDINNDGVNDIVIGAPGSNPLKGGETYIIYGQNNTLFSDIDLNNLTKNQGFKITGGNSLLGVAVDSLGDVNGDRIDDIIIAAFSVPYLFYARGTECYIMFGKNNTFISDIDLNYLSYIDGFKIHSNTTLNIWGTVGGVGDINNDGVNDISIGITNASPLGRNNAGETFIIFGRKNVPFEDIDLTYLNKTTGFKIAGAHPGDMSGYSVRRAGDINGDRINDFLIGANNASPFNKTSAGVTYVIYGKNNTDFEDIDLAYLNKTQGFKITGAHKYGYSGSSVNYAGDINADGIGDIIIGASGGSPSKRSAAGVTYVIYGKNTTDFDDIDLAYLNKTLGFRITGSQSNDLSGSSVSWVYDINGDNIDDIIIGAPNARSLDREVSGESYIVYGNKNFSNNIDLSTLEDTHGITIYGASYGDFSGYSVSGIGDINNDGFNDFIIGTRDGEESYVIYGAKYSLPSTNIIPEDDRYFLEIGVPIICSTITVGIAAFIWYKYNQCNGLLVNESEGDISITKIGGGIIDPVM